MKALILAAGYATRLNPITLGRPKPLLRIGDHTILDYLVDGIEASGGFDEIVLISNHKFVGHFERWRMRRETGTPICILDDGTTENANRRGAIGDMHFAIETHGIEDDIYVMAADNMAKFDLMALVPFFLEKRESAVYACWEEDLERIKRSGSVRFDEQTGMITDFVEKPEEPLGHWRVPAFYVYPKDVLPLVAGYLDKGGNADAPGHFLAWLYEQRPVYVLSRMQGTYDIGTIESYEKVCRMFGAEPEEFGL